jgi:hypothetical protein
MCFEIELNKSIFLVQMYGLVTKLTYIKRCGTFIDSTVIYLCQLAIF